MLALVLLDAWLEREKYRRFLPDKESEG